MPDLVILKGFHCLPFGFHSEATCERNIKACEGALITLQLEAYMSAPCLYGHRSGSFPFWLQPGTWKIIHRHRLLHQLRPQFLEVREGTERVMCADPSFCLSILTPSKVLSRLWILSEVPPNPITWRSLVLVVEGIRVNACSRQRDSFLSGHLPLKPVFG